MSIAFLDEQTGVRRSRLSLGLAQVGNPRVWVRGGRVTRPGQCLELPATGPVKFCRFSPDGYLFASSSCDRTIRLWDLSRAKCLWVLKGEWGWDWVPHGQPGSPFQACVSCHFPLLCHWDDVSGHQRSVETLSFSPDSRQLASGGWDKQVMLWEVQVCGGAGGGQAWVRRTSTSHTSCSASKALLVPHCSCLHQTWMTPTAGCSPLPASVHTPHQIVGLKAFARRAVSGLLFLPAV